MGNHYTRIVRVFEKSPDRKLNIERICSSILSSSMVEYELLVLDNDKDGCVDLKWTANRAGGELDIDFRNFDVWEIRGGGGYSTVLFNEEILTNRYVSGNFAFGFDEIQVRGKIGLLTEFFNELFGIRNSFMNQIITIDNQTVSYKQQGLYRSECYYKLGEYVRGRKYVDNYELARVSSRDEFLELRGESGGPSNILITDARLSDRNLNLIMDNFDKSNSTYETNEQTLYPNMESLSFLWNGRTVSKVLKLEHTNEWTWFNSDWWDNCMCPQWIEYRIKRKYAS